MQPLDDYPINEGPGRPSPHGSPKSSGPWVLILVVLAVVIGVGVFLWRRAPEAEPPRTAADVTPPVEETADTPRTPLGPEVEPRELPPLDLSDPVVRELVTGLSARPELATWLAGDNLIRNVVVSVDNVANGRSPATHVRRLAPKEPFAVQARGDTMVVDQRSYERYNGLADMVSSLDAQGVARTYAILRPRLQEAYRELGYPEGNFDVAAERAIARLLRVPAIEPETRLSRGSVMYTYADPKIESLSAAEKQLLRMGPRNVQRIQAKLREIAQALRVQADQLPR